MIKKIWNNILDFIFEDEEEEINEAQYMTLFYFTKRTLITHGNLGKKDAEKTAIVLIDQWIRDGEFFKNLYGVWENTKTA